MTNQSTPFLNEPLTPQLGGMIKGGLAAIGVYVLIGAVAMFSRETDPEALLVLAIILGVAVAGLLGLWWLCNRERLIMDEAGVHTRSLRGKTITLPWNAIRTAAVVSLSAHPLHRWIVLSAEPDPAQVLVRQRLMRGKPYTDAELRLPFGVKRCAMLEQQLHMRLPNISL